MVISSIMIGGVVGVGFAGFLADKIGRRKVLLIGAACFFFAALWSAFTYSPWTLIAALVLSAVSASAWRPHWPSPTSPSALLPSTVAP